MRRARQKGMLRARQKGEPLAPIIGPFNRISRSAVPE